MQAWIHHICIARITKAIPGESLMPLEGGGGKAGFLSAKNGDLCVLMAFCQQWVVAVPKGQGNLY